VESGGGDTGPGVVGEAGVGGASRGGAPLVEKGGEFFSEGVELGVGEVRGPEGFDEEAGFAGGKAGSVDAGEVVKDFQGEAGGALGDGDAGVFIKNVGNAKGDFANRGEDFAGDGAGGGGGRVGAADAGEVMRFFVDEKLEEEAEAFLKDGVAGGESSEVGRGGGRGGFVSSGSEVEGVGGVGEHGGGAGAGGGHGEKNLELGIKISDFRFKI